MTPTHDIHSLRRMLTHDAQLARVDQFVATNGEAAGDRVIQGGSLGGLHFTIHPDRGLDLGQLSFAGCPLGWVGPSGFPAANRFQPDGEDGLGILRAFSGFLVTCGYDYFGAAANGPADHFGYVLRDKQSYPVHGRAWTLPATIEVCRLDWNNPEPAIQIEGTLDQRTLLGEQIQNRRQFRFPIGRPVLELVDRITNVGHRPVPHRILYHINLGFPLIDEGTRIDGLPDHTDFPTPLPAIEENQDERVRLIPRPDCSPTITVHRDANPPLSLALDFLTDNLTHVIQWWNRYHGMNVVGIEPASAGLPEPAPDGQWHPDAWLDPGETAEYRLRFTANTPS